MFRRLPAALQAALALALLLATAAPFSDEAYAQGNSDRAHQCQQGGYLTLMRSDFTRFRNTGECVRYASQGGMFAQAEIHVVVAPGPVVNWISLTVVGSGFPHSRPFLVTITSAPGQPTYSRTWFSSLFNTFPDGSLVLSGSFAENGCIEYSGMVILTVTVDSIQASTTPFQSPC